MIAIGSSLREARERRGLELAQIEAETRIRAKQLAALESERFDALPARVYARAFLREYADFLGLDSDQFLDEFDARFPIVEEEPLAPTGLPQPWRLPRYSGALAVVVAFIGLAVLGWKIEQSESPPETLVPRAPAKPQAPVSAPPRERARAASTLVLVAVRGRCWIEAHEESRAGPLLLRRTLEPGGRISLPAGRLWLRVGAPWNLDARLGGKRIALPGRVANLVVTTTAVHVESA